MTDAGRAVIAAAKADGSWSILESVEALSVPADLAASLAARPGADERWEAMVASARRPYLLWIATAKRPETRARRVLETADRVALGLRYEDR